jgi:hypothetical protein
MPANSENNIASWHALMPNSEDWWLCLCVTPHPHWAGVKTDATQTIQILVFLGGTLCSLTGGHQSVGGTCSHVTWARRHERCQKRAKSPWPGHESLSFTPQSKEIRFPLQYNIVPRYKGQNVTILFHCSIFITWSLLSSLLKWQSLTLPFCYFPYWFVFHYSSLHTELPHYSDLPIQ